MNCLYVFPKGCHPGGQVSTLITRISHILVKTCFVLIEIIFSVTLKIALIPLELLEAAVVLLLNVLPQMHLQLCPVFTLITVNVINVVVSLVVLLKLLFVSELPITFWTL